MPDLRSASYVLCCRAGSFRKRLALAHDALCVVSFWQTGAFGVPMAAASTVGAGCEFRLQSVLQPPLSQLAVLSTIYISTPAPVPSRYSEHLIFGVRRKVHSEHGLETSPAVQLQITQAGGTRVSHLCPAP